jgi:hypothetical protein
VFARSDSLLGCMAEIVGCELLSSDLCLVHKGARLAHLDPEAWDGRHRGGRVVRASRPVVAGVQL